jgi:anaerobic dimethyl sulfoxide reductase subunit B (iron-sulfur subunit)
MQYGFFFDQTRCIGCNACTIACKDYNQVNPGRVRWRKQQAFEDMNGAAPVFYNLSMSCNHCAEPACKAACPFGAIIKDDKGRVIIDRRKCENARSCIDACPFAAPDIAEDLQEPKGSQKKSWKRAHPAQKCTFCFERVDDGETPVCVSACVGHALDYGDIDDLEKRHPDAVRLNRADFPYAYMGKGTAETNPSFLIRKRKKLAVSVLKT